MTISGFQNLRVSAVRPDLDCDYVEQQKGKSQQRRTIQGVPRSNSESAFEPGAGNRQPVAASFTQSQQFFTAKSIQNSDPSIKLQITIDKLSENTTLTPESSLLFLPLPLKAHMKATRFNFDEKNDAQQNRCS